MVVATLDWFDIMSTVQCGQLFRYQIIDNATCKVISKDKVCIIEQCENCVKIATDNLDYFVNYFDTTTNYNQIIDKLSTFKELEQAIDFGKGIRILRQDLLETIISFIVSANNNIGRIRGTIDKISTNFGTKIDSDTFAFPTIQQLSNITVDEWVKHGAGYRAPYLVKSIKTIGEQNIIQNITAQLENTNENKNLIKQNIYKILLSLQGIGPKVADCIMLFALRFTDSFPVDTWIYNSLKTTALDTKAKVRDYYSKRYGDLCGYAQQYIFYYNRSN